ncbi:hypothetical protein CUMW_097390 [Citrus unshiu]|uniref:START domain-containing protein n=1 Tax=Citrus unshiu TaxID=55188 RepID=A0A2H5P282_CITUN|nr:hypothetical protein CUMW_097390 [Citrus unshiu]
MGIARNESKIEGWLYAILVNRIGMQISRKRYFILLDNCLNGYKMVPSSEKEEPVKSAMIHSCIRVTDNGRESINRKVLFVFTLYNSLDHNEKLKLGARSPEEAAKWIRSLQEAAVKECPCPTYNFVAVSKRRWPSLRLYVSKRSDYKYSGDWTLGSSIRSEATASDVIAPSPWKIFGCQNGLRLFKEAKDWDSRGRHWDDHPAIMAVGVVDGTSEAIFQTLMSLGSSRSEWDFCFYRGCVVEHLDGHSDVVHKLLYSDWLPWGMQRRDLLVRRYWRREDDGTYVILYHSVNHKKCPKQKGYVRACLKSGGFVITPSNQGKQSIVKHMLAVDWKYWKLYLRPSSARSITIRMLERVAALRELFQAKAGNTSSEFLSRGSTREIKAAQDSELPEDIQLKNEEDTEIEIQKIEEIRKTEKDAPFTEEKPSSGRASLMGINDASDEFFDVPEAYSDHMENDWSLEVSPELQPLSAPQSKLASAAGFVKKLHDLAVHKKGCTDLQEVPNEDEKSWSYGATLQTDSSFTSPCSWAAADPSTFLIRGENYLKDHRKIKADGTLMQMIGADWLRSNKREDNLAARPCSLVQKYAAGGGPEFFFVVNIQGSWIVKQSVGKTACLLGRALEVNYYRGRNYLEIQIDVGSSTVATGVASLVLGYLNNLVIEMAFLIQGETEEELPEFLLGTCRLNHLDVSKSVVVKK